MSTIITTVFFSGRVQGVGFRYKTRQIATGYEITGYVKNLPDGRVELVAEGQSQEVEDFLETVCSDLDVFIRRFESSSRSGQNAFRDFLIQG